MGIFIILGVAVVAVYLSRNSGGIALTGTLQGRTIPPIVGSYAPAPVGNPSYSRSSTGNNAVEGLITGNVAGNANATAGDAASAFVASGQGFAQGFAAGGPIGGAVGAAMAAVNSLVGRHAARLKGATNENNAAVQIVPTVDSFIAQIVQMYNSGQIDEGSAAQGLASFDQQVYQQLRSLVGAPGTSWDDNVGMSGQCNKACTVGCCLYFGDLGPPLSLLRYILGDRTGRWGGNDPRLNGRTVTVPKVYPGKYTQFSRASYTVTLA